MLNTFSQFLLQNDYASLAELEEAGQATVLYGGRLGTALIELGLLSPEQLDSALARHHGLPEIPKEWLAKPDAGARAALHVDLVKRHRAFPLQFEKRSLHVGMVDPRNDAILDDLAFASGCSIVPYALAEFRFVQLMQRVFGVAPSTRFKALLDEGAHARVFRERQQQRARITAERENVHAELEVGPLAANVELGASDEFTFTATAPLPEPAPAVVAVRPPRLPPARPADEPAPRAQAAGAALAQRPNEPPLELDAAPLLLDRRAPVASLEALERIVVASDERAQVIDASVELAARFAAVAALFVVRDRLASGLVARRGGESLDIEATGIPLGGESLLAGAAASGKPARGMPACAVDKALARALGSSESAELVVYPVAIGERVVNLLVVQPESETLGATAEAGLTTLVPLISAAYERLIRAQKQKAAVGAAKPLTAAAPAKAAIGALPLKKRVVRVADKK
ncbi:MAG TPA: hypothetical protein VFT98_22705 [Myxococcota bacterium]|nr:hypothetical protein [Myxococcota bacterium]